MPRITSKPVQTIGMDWLSHQLGQINCARKLNYLPSSFGEHVRFSPKLQGPHLFALKAKPSLDIRGVPAMCDFVDVFSKDLPGMPPVRKLKFVIEWYPVPPQCQQGLLVYPEPQENNDVIWVVIDRVTKVAHFLPYTSKGIPKLLLPQTSVA